MAFQQFSFPAVIADLGLTFRDADLFATVPTLSVRSELSATILEGANLASAINTEKARSEFVIAPVLLELRRLRPGTFGLFSGVELVADANRGLNGVCDFLLTRSPQQHVITAPLLTVVEAKNENLRNGLGQCIASMFAAFLFNQQHGQTSIIYGAVTTGSLWKFLRLEDTTVTIDLVEYHIDNLGKVLGILAELVA